MNGERPTRKYTKEQAEMLALLVLMGCAVVVLTFLYLVKPNFAAMSESKAELEKTEAEIAELSKAPVELAKAAKERDALTATIEKGEKAILAGLAIDPPLTQVCLEVANKLGLKPAFGVQSPNVLLEFKERATDGTQVTRHYGEVSRTLDIHSADFLALYRFLSGVEKANDGIRVTHLEIGNKALSPQDQEAGKVKAKVKLSMLGIREGERSAPPEVKDIGEFDERNPFAPAAAPGGGGSSQDLVRVLKGIRVTAIWSDRLMMEVPGSGSIEATKGKTFVVGKMKMRYVSGAGDTFVFETADLGKRYKLITNWRGQVKKVEEEETK
jgi:hypothetical protein